MQFGLSIIIPTYNGANKITSIFKALSEQSFSDFECIVVIDGSKDNTIGIIKNTDFGLKDLKIIEQPNGGRSVSRNRGAKEAKGDILLFLDDDTRPQPDCLEKHLQHHQKFPESLLVGNVPEDKAKMKTDIQKYKAFLSNKWVKPLNDTEKPMDEKSLFLTAANFSIPQKVFWNVGGYDEQLTDAEDFDLGVRAFQKKYPIYFNINNIAWHNDFITAKSYIRRLRQYRLAHQKLKDLKPEIYAQFNRYEYNQIGWFKKWIYAFFAQKFWLWSIDVFNWMRILPQKLRYKLYDVIITGFAVYFPDKKL